MDLELFSFFHLWLDVEAISMTNTLVLSCGKQQKTSV